MNFRRVMGAAALFAAALVGVSAAAQNANGSTTSGARNWLTQVVATDAGHRIGNPNAAVRLTQYISYTCPHCAAFAREGDGALELAYVGTGRISVEVRHLIRDPIDLTVALITHCGAAGKFRQNHIAFLRGQDSWIAPLSRHTAAQEQRWRLPGAAGRKAIAGDFGFYRIMERRGYTRTEVDRCLGDEALARRLSEASAKDWQLPGISGTPAFAIGGNVLAHTHNWAELEPQLSARF